MMKKNLLLLTLLLTLCGLQDASAQKRVREFGLFNHLGVGASIGTAGFGVELSAPLTDFLQVRAGYSGLSGTYTEKDVAYNVMGTKGKTDVDAKLNMGDVSLLFDAYPFAKYTFHVTAGFFYGKEKAVKMHNAEPISGANGALEVGEYLVGFDRDGYAHAAVQVNKFKPYLGIGFGHAVPRKRVGVSLDMGLQFWGKPSLYGQTVGGTDSWTKLESRDLDDKGDKFVDIISRIAVYPVITLRFNGRIF